MPIKIRRVIIFIISFIGIFIINMLLLIGIGELPFFQPLMNNAVFSYIAFLWLFITLPLLGAYVMQKNYYQRLRHYRKLLAVFVILAGTFTALFVISTAIRFIGRTPLYTLRPVSDEELLTYESFTLEKKTAAGTETLATFSMYDDPTIVRFKDYLFYDLYEDEALKLMQLNVRTGESKAIFTEKDTRNGINYLALIDNTVFFTTGAYMSPGGLYWYDPQRQTPVTKIDTLANGRINYTHNRYLLIGGEGDGCGGGTNYNQFFPKTKTILHIATTGEGCVNGEGTVGIDKYDRLILADHVVADEKEYPPMTIIYNYVVAIPLDAPSQRTMLITREQMPKDVIDVRYKEKTDSLLLETLHKKYYTYSLTQKKLIETYPTDEVTPTPAIYNDEGARQRRKNTFQKLQKDLKLPEPYTLTAK